ncbi:unnamed protein product [Meganyctiphanes norvegica]|uniref:Spaetzle domain-containing protein n=1 Tax=Meganyctiphanes norvegica TaxID=48144 RepID=A0AAV2QAU0_MEGNR
MWRVVVGMSFCVLGLLPSEVGPTYPSSPFIPAMPGMTPDCVQDPRDTYCTKTYKYPKERIVYLLENKMFDTDTLLRDETRDTYTFEARDAPKQPPQMMYGYDPPSSGYLPPQPQNTSTRYGPPASKYGSPPTLYDAPLRYDEEGPYPRYAKQSYTPQPPSLRYTPPPRSPPKPQPWWRKHFSRGSRHRQKRQLNGGQRDLCPSESSYIMPRAGLNTNGDYMYLVNLNEVSPQYTQLVRSEKCVTARCTGACDVPEGFTAVCQQQYVQKRLIALDGSGSKLNTDTFWFPSCCLCKLRPNAG